MTDAFALEQFSAAVIQGLRDELVLPCNDGEIRFVPMPQLADLQLPAHPEVRFISAEQSNSSAIIDNKVMIKLLRRVAPGVHPELEMGGFLTERGFAHISGMLGQVSRINKQGEPVALMVIQHFLDSQGDAWVWTLNNLDRAVRDEIAGGVSMHENQFSALDELQAFNRLLGQRLGEMHMALATQTEDPAFAYESTSKADTKQWEQSVSAQLEQALQRLEEHRSSFDRKEATALGQLLARRDKLLEQVQRLAARTVGGVRTRVHGDLHLGQVLVVQGDAYFIDFEGEPARSLDERRAKRSPFKDVSGLLRSFEYAAAMTIRGAQVSDTTPEADQARQRIAASYQRSAQQAFLDAYREATRELPHAWQEQDGANAALLLFSLEKCAYEIVYEAENRPTWLPVPLQGLLALAQQLFDGGSND